MPPRDVRSALLRPATPPLWLGIVIAAVVIALETLVIVLLEHLSPGETFEPVYLLGILVVSMVWGLGLAVATSLVSAIALAYFGGARPGDEFGSFSFENGVLVVVFLVAALCTNFIAGLARVRAFEAEQRRREAEDAKAGLRESRDRIGVLAEQQAALRRVATLVARGAPGFEVFSTVAEQLARALGTANASLWRYESDGTATLVSAHDDPSQNTAMPVGSRWSLEGDNIVGIIRASGRPARIDTDDSPGSAAARIRERGLRGGVGAPIVVESNLWGAAVVGSAEPGSLPPDTEARVADFADLVATAIANAESRAELTASRVRIVAAGDEARRRLERDLHDGAQQRLVSLALELRSLQDSVPSELDALNGQIARVASGLAAASENLQELSRGIHPAILSKGGLVPALKTLARRCPVPVDLDVAVERRLPDSVEIGAYYAVAEALTNAAKYAQASEVSVRAAMKGDSLCLSIRDDGIGGADSRKGSGLIGLKDRIEALGGHVLVTSPTGLGTSLYITIPVEVHDSTHLV
ncbi:GAF domain-containing protein [Nocardia sp. CA-135398]|uniref:GAF domain-containing sensor histidine kinase n=1 Tax=Nocardia sp. CA-135398 TaxID=3239977 RepID=UPI003D96328E